MLLSRVVTVISAVPAEIALTTPFLSTDATSGFDQVNKISDKALNLIINLDTRQKLTYNIIIPNKIGNLIKNLCTSSEIDAYFPVLRNICTADDAMNPENAKRNLAFTAQQVFRVIDEFIK